MPQMGVSVAEGTIVEWIKRPGDWVEADETVCMVTTDKVDVEIPSPGTGRLTRILVEEGDTVDVGTPLAELDASARPGEAHPEEHEQGTAPADATPAPEQDGGDGELDRSRFYSPVVRRIADKHGVDLARVEGTGIGGRVRKRDVLAHIESGGAAAEERTERAKQLHIESPYRPEPAASPPGNGGGSTPEPTAEPAGAPAAGAPDVSDGLAAERREPMSIMRKRIA
ncbi:MAG: biotin/lipoyl-containing protein, partial [Solirubrobacterales bacterium]